MFISKLILTHTISNLKPFICVLNQTIIYTEMDKKELLQNNPPEDQQPVRGRNAVMNRWRESNPDFEGDPEDDDLYDYAIGQADDYKSRYDKQNEVNSALASRISEDPRFGALIAGVMETSADGKRKNPAYVIAKLYGKDFLEDEEALKAMDEGYAEYLEGAKKTEDESMKAQQNFLESMKRVDTYAQANGLAEERVEELRHALVNAADEMLMGNFSDSFIETVAKGLSHDADVQDAADTGYVEGKNEKVAMKFGNGEGDMPSMGTATKNPRKIKEKEPEKKSFFDDMKSV